MNGDNLIEIKGYSNSDYADDKDTRRIITGLVTYQCGVPISWKAKDRRQLHYHPMEANIMQCLSYGPN